MSIPLKPAGPAALLSLKSCPRCGCPHPDMILTLLDRPTESFNAFAYCPCTGTPIMVSLVIALEPGHAPDGSIRPYRKPSKVKTDEESVSEAGQS
jgi:hypothetical protein